MKEIRTIMKKADDPAAIREAGEIIRRGGLVAFPTETVYGLGADAMNREAAEKIYAAKGRPSDNPLIVHINHMEDLAQITDGIPEAARKVAEAFWPGPLTMIFEKSEAVPLETTGGLQTVAVRMPAHPAAQAFIEAGGGLIAAPSANTSGRPSPTTAQHVWDDLNGAVDMILDGGPVSIGVESTILDMTVTPPMILRPGAITREALLPLLGEVAVDNAAPADRDARPKAPGMKYRHYAPKAELAVVEGPMEMVIAAINELCAKQMGKGYKVGIIATKESIGRYPEGDVKSIGTRGDLSTIANNLYRVLREFDADGVDYIYSESFSTGGIGSAVMNRLLKAAGHQIINA